MLSKIDTASDLAAPVKALGKGVIKNAPTLAIGVREHLYDFAKKIGGITWKDLTRQNPGREWRDLVSEVIHDPTKRVAVNLDGIDNAYEAARKGVTAVPDMTLTDWELGQIYSNKEIWGSIDFYSGGKQVPNPWK